MRPRTHYARSGDYSIAYQVLGEGDRDIVFVPGWVSNVEHLWAWPGVARFFRRLATFGRVITFDKRGTGLSDRLPVDRVATLEERLDDLRAVMDAAGSSRASLFGFSEGGTGSAVFAATHPQAVETLILFGAIPKYTSSDDYGLGFAPEHVDALVAYVEENWGTGEGVAFRNPSMAGDPGFREWFAALERTGASPGAAANLMRTNLAVDIRPVLSSIRVPTLVLHRVDDQVAPIGHGRHLAEAIPGALLVELAGGDHMPWCGDADAVLDEVEEFLTGERGRTDPDRLVATVLFTDIVDSTGLLARAGDSRWAELMERHDEVVRREVDRCEGEIVKSTGDGVHAVFDGPIRAVHCACALRDALGELGLPIRAGLHTGECQIIAGQIGGLAVHIAARVAHTTPPGEVWVSDGLRRLAAGSALRFEPRGAWELKGITGDTPLFEVLSS